MDDQPRPTANSSTEAPASSAQLFVAPARHSLRRFPKGSGARRSAAVLASGSLPSNPFQNCLVLGAVDYIDQINPIPQPIVSVQNMLPTGSIVSSGLTLELWFNAHASGVLIGQQMSGTSTDYLAPLLFVDGQGRLVAGLFDGSQIDLVSPPQTIVVGLDTNQQQVIGAASQLSTPMSVIDGDWHHAALVVVPGQQSLHLPGQQSLYLDGHLVDTVAGSFQLSFTDTTGQPYSPGSTAQIGGCIIPMPQSNPLPPLNYPQGFEGLIDELRIWSVPRAPGELQLSMQTPLGTAQPDGLFGYYPFDSTAAPAPSLPTTYAALIPSTVPFDTFPQLTNRLPGYQNYGIQLATPFASPVVQVDFSATPTYSIKISLKQGDRLQIGLPTRDISKDQLDGLFTIAATSGVTGQAMTVGGISPGDSPIITADYTGVYQIDLSYNQSAAADISFMMVSGPSNLFMQLLQNFGSDDQSVMLMAYSDPLYPTTTTSVPDPRPGKSGTVELPAYWPLFSDTATFGTQFDQDELLSAYLNLVEQTPAKLNDGSTFGDYFNLMIRPGTTASPAELNYGLGQAYLKLTNGIPPPALPQGSPIYGPGPYDSALDQVYAFIYNANYLRQTLETFLNNYQNWVDVNPAMLFGSAVPGSIANMMYDQQGQPAPRLVSRLSGGALAINLIVGALLVGLGAVAVPVFGVAAGAAATALSFADAAGATIGSELLGTFVSTSSSRMVQPPNLNSYTTLTDVATHIQSDFETLWPSAKAQLQDVGFRQAVYSNYGLLQAFQVIDPESLSDGQFNDPELCANSPLVQGITYASWQQLVPAIFSWQCMSYQPQPGNAKDFSPFIGMGVCLAQGNSDAEASSPSNLVELNDVFDGPDLPALQQALYQLPLAQCQQSELNTWPSIQPGAFFCVTAANCMSAGYGWEIGAILQQWYLVDRNSKTMDGSLTQKRLAVSWFSLSAATARFPAGPLLRSLNRLGSCASIRPAHRW